MGNPSETGTAPGLYLIATPIGTARDITLRALDLLAGADVLAAEDTRSLRKLMQIHGIARADRPLLSYHDHNGARMRPRLLAELAEGKSVVYASEAGMPMIADPGYDLARAAREAGHAVTVAPGASAPVTALALSGLPTDRFFFGGFLPSGGNKRKAALAALAQVPGTLVFFESPARTAAMLADAAEALGGDRPAAIARELTKRFEEVQRGTLEELAARSAAQGVKGEVVVLIGEAPERPVNESDLDSALEQALETRTVRDAADSVARQLSLPRRRVYQRALELEGKA
ncbi:16S rRNA (cytidine(1402)-2'-O)-methyltransferase [Roseovarius salinarum]|uniref:16S rRNA (cytidine(1402)-2'-O)-methyltransferase n=1 Tax=Roseovarius salinarum TaxID=1981892 RepID=UPI001E499D67|nr:16S rRNA (cytidine(1402)-2'-O)-methyltransferase [Roseovarius salinarum]